MGTPINKGSDDPQLQKQSYNFDWRRGTTYSEDWKGINQSKMITLWNGKVFFVNGARMNLQNSMAEATFEWSSFGGGATDPASKEVTIDRWEIPEPKMDKPLISHPFMYDAFWALGGASGGWGQSDAAVANYAARFQQGIALNTPPESFGSGDAAITGWFIDDKDHFPGWNSLSSDYQQFLIRQYNRCLNGQTHYQSSTYSLRHTTNIPSYWTADVSDGNVNRVYSTSQLVSECQSSQFNYPLPERFSYKVNAAESQFTASLPVSAHSRAGYMVGWLKSPFSESSVGRGRIEIQGGYVLDQWPLDIYPAAI